MADVTLHDSTEITLDFNKITIVEFRNMSETATAEEEDQTISKVVGVDISKLGFADYWLVVNAFKNKVKEIVDPNSASAST